MVKIIKKAWKKYLELFTEMYGPMIDANVAPWV